MDIHLLSPTEAPNSLMCSELLSRFTDWNPQPTTLLEALWLLMAEAGFPFWATQSRGYRLPLEGNQEVSGKVGPGQTGAPEAQCFEFCA